ncbi:MotA/TolQ/ExbB proton channel family protein [Caballeronia sordidicola]|uniref:MotA/TolQ/ExbB proton channel family protein n=1 Tax=Caballeronia sordidicola TaxID=196367 RepID=A0A242MYA3_CABSO|nr:MotA/TolQ/ExbB proton channel family protein [Caballeronia sordidicola]
MTSSRPELNRACGTSRTQAQQHRARSGDNVVLSGSSSDAPFGT